MSMQSLTFVFVKIIRKKEKTSVKDFSYIVCVGGQEVQRSGYLLGVLVTKKYSKELRE